MLFRDPTLSDPAPGAITQPCRKHTFVGDCWNDSLEGAPVDGSVRAGGDCTFRAVRGGEFDYATEGLRSAVREFDNGRRNNMGFRVARTLGASGVVFRDCDHCPEMVAVPAGEFVMGSPRGESDLRSNSEGPQHSVTIAEPFAAGRYEVTFAEWDTCVNRGGCLGYRPPADYGRGRQPVINVSWRDVQAYLAWLRLDTGHPYRLLSEAEWEYAARAGTTTPFWTGQTISPAQANFNPSNLGGENKAVGSYPPNSWGLYDTSGNVREWVEDCFHQSYEGAPSDGSAWTNGETCGRVMRGGSWAGPSGYIRSARRDSMNSDDRSNSGSLNDFGSTMGFRVARKLDPVVETRPPAQ